MGPGTKLRQPLTQLMGDTGLASYTKVFGGSLAPIGHSLGSVGPGTTVLERN